MKCTLKNWNGIFRWALPFPHEISRLSSEKWRGFKFRRAQVFWLMCTAVLGLSSPQWMNQFVVLFSVMTRLTPWLLLHIYSVYELNIFLGALD